MTKLFVKCPGCGNHMRTDPRNVISAVKRCVYCGKSFKVHTPGGVSRILLTAPSLEVAGFEDG